MNDVYRVRIRRGDSEFEVESSDKEFVEGKLAEWEQAYVESEPRMASVARPSAVGEQKPLSMQEFVSQLGVTTGIDKILAIAYYLEKYSGRDGLHSSDITVGLREIREKHSNPYDAVAKLRRRGWLMDAEESGKFMLSRSGEKEVERRMASDET